MGSSQPTVNQGHDRPGTICQGFVGAVGNTPLIRLHQLSALTGCEILGKAEFMNPGGSVKDRAALGILLEAEEGGQLQPRGHGRRRHRRNTGIGLTHLCNARGYRSLIVIPDTQSAEKIDLLRSLGADVRTRAGGSLPRPQQLREALGPAPRAETPGAIWANQFGQSRQPARPLPHPPSGDLGADRRPCGCLGVGNRHGRHLCRGGALSQGAFARRALRARRSPMAAPSTAGQRLAN